jgi:hypothetical protein
MRVEVSREAGSGPGTVRVVGKIKARDAERLVWYEFPEDLAPEVGDSGESWALLMLPLASRTGEPIELDLPVDPLFLENVRGLTATWSHWYADLRQVSILAPTQPAPPSHGKAAQFFSGGLDSWFTLLRHSESTQRFPQVGHVDDVITIQGFGNIPIDQQEENRKLAQSVRETAEHYGKRSLPIATNMRVPMDHAWKMAWLRWGPQTHGVALAAAALFLSRRYSAVKIASTHRFWESFPYGSHPMTDTLYSTSRTTFSHDHALYGRPDKIERIAESDYAVGRLRVCNATKAARNCSQCIKCHRMLLCFDSLGLLDKAKSFDVELYRRNKDRPFLIWNDNDHVRALEVRDVALRRDRKDIAAIIDESLRRSRRIRRSTQPLKKVSWRAFSALYARMAGDMIGA